MSDRVRLYRHTESYEVRLADGTSRFWYFEDKDPVRRTLMNRTTSKVAEQEARAFAGAERDKISQPPQE